MSGASRRQQSDVYSDRIIVRSLPWQGEMHEYKKAGGSKESQDHHEIEQTESLSVQLSYLTSPVFCLLPLWENHNRTLVYFLALTDFF